MGELVSILIPAYNAERWIGDTVRSALNQTWAEKEIIIVDDGSSDNTLRIAKLYESHIVKVVTQNNSGACSARNKALSLAQGDYIQWLDADDLLAPDKLSCQLRGGDIGRDSRVLLTSAFGTFYYRVSKAKFKPSSLWQDLEPVDWIKLKFTENAWMNPAAWLVSRRLTEIAGPWDDRLAWSSDDDGEYICRVVLASEKIQFNPGAKSYYRVGHGNSLSSRRSDSAYTALLLSTKLSVGHLLKYADNKDTRAACIRLLENRLWHFHPEKGELVKELEALGKQLGADELSLVETRKYLMVAKYFGGGTAKDLRQIISGIKAIARKYWDKFLFVLLAKHRSFLEWTRSAFR